MELELQASAYAGKTGSSRRPIGAIRDVHNSDIPIPSRIARKAVKRVNFLSHEVEKGRKLTKKEREVLGLLSEGFRYKEIGQRLNIVPETVRSHVKSICRKMGVRRRVEAIAKHLKDI